MKDGAVAIHHGCGGNKVEKRAGDNGEVRGGTKEWLAELCEEGEMVGYILYLRREWDFFQRSLTLSSPGPVTSRMYPPAPMTTRP